MSVGSVTRRRYPAETLARADGASPDQGPGGIIHPDQLGLPRLEISTPAREAGPIADMIAIVRTDQVEEPPRLRTDGTLAQPWNRLHCSIQDELLGLWDRISRERSGRLTRSGLVSTPTLPMFSYRAFYRRALEEEDPIIVGVEIWPESEGYKILGEICGEESGRSYFDEVAGSSREHAELERVVGAIARRLADQVGVVVAALDEP